MRTEGNWTGAGVVESLPLEDQEKGRNILLPKNAYDLSGSVQAVYVENHAEECVELCVGQKLGTIHSLCKQAWVQEELRGSTVRPRTFRCGLLRNNIPFSGVLWSLFTLEVYGCTRDRVRRACDLGTVYDTEERVL